MPIFNNIRDETGKIATSLKVDNCSEAFLDEVEASVKLQQKSGDGKVYTQLDLFKPPRMRIVTIVEMYQWFATTLVYYGNVFQIKPAWVRGLKNS